MSRKAVIVTGGELVDDEELKLYADFSYVVGVDRGAWKIIEAGLRLDLAIGDFDSVKKNELFLIKKKAKKTIQYSSDKNQTDAELALAYIFKKRYEEIFILGGFGNRADHSLVNVFLLEKYTTSGQKVRIKNRGNEIFLLRQGSKIEIINDKQYKYISFLSLTDKSVLTLKGFRYPLEKKIIKRKESLSVSNEFREKTAFVHVHKGKVLLIKSNDIK